MAKLLFDGLVSWLGHRGLKANERDMLTHAKTEYKSDWEYAYFYMLSHDGRGPKMGSKY